MYMLQFFLKLFSFCRQSLFTRCIGGYSRQDAAFGRLAVLFICIIPSVGAHGQSYSISATTRWASIIGTSAFFRGEVNNNGVPVDMAQIYALRLGKRLDDDRYWHSAYMHPEVGVGFEFLDIGNDPETGDPLSAYMYLESGLIDCKRFRLSFATDLGLSYFWKPYNAQTNVNNVSLGSRLNYHAGIGLRGEVFLTENIALLLATTFNHHSNGAITKPNLGVNMASAELGLKCYLKPRVKRTSWSDTIRRKNVYSDLSIYMGTRNVDIDGPYYQFYGLHINRVWPVSSKFGFGTGLELMYDQASFAEQERFDALDRSSVALYAAAHVRVDKLSLSLDIGRYIHRKDGDRIPVSQYYQRLSLRYQLTVLLFASVKVRAFELRKADLLEFHIGIKL